MAGQLRNVMYHPSANIGIGFNIKTFRKPVECTGTNKECFSSSQGCFIFRAWQWVTSLPQPTQQCLRRLLTLSITIKHDTANIITIYSEHINIFNTV